MSRPWWVLACATLAACAQPPAPAPEPVGPATEPLAIGPAAVDTVGGWLPDDTTLSPVDVTNPLVGWLDPGLLTAVQHATREAAGHGVDIRVASGWRSEGFQQRLFDDAVIRYGSAEAASRFVASPQTSKHVAGQAVDIAPADADRWLIENGPRFGLCQVYANEIWHFELAADDQGRCPPLKPTAAG